MVLNKKYSGYVLASLILLLLPFLYLILFTHPIADDLVFGFKAKTEGLFEVSKKTYLTWNGRYSGNFFAYLFPISIDNLVLYRVVLLCCFLFFILGFKSFISSLLVKVNSVAIWAISLLGVLTYLSITTNIAEGFYWFTGVIYYQLGLSLFLFFLALVILYLRQSFFINKMVHLSVMFLIEFVTIGMNETIAIITAFICFVLLIVVLTTKKEHRLVFFSILLVSIIGLSLVVFSPGNESRMATYDGNQDLLKSFLMSFLQLARFTISFVLSFSGLFFILFTACFYPHFTPLLKKIKARYLILCFPVIVYLCIFPSYYATGILGQHRTLNVAALFFVILLTVIALKVGDGLKDRLPRKPEKMLLYYILFFFIIGNGRTVMADLFNNDAQQYSEELDKRYVVLKEKKSTSDLYKLGRQPKSIFVIDISGDSTNWVDQSYLLEYK